jgi:glycosyltransferase involved in cell wall biosynthesis
MRILFVAPWIPSPVRPRSLAFLHMLAGQHDVGFLALTRHDDEARLAGALPVRRATLVRNGRAGSMVRSLAALGAGRSLQHGYASPRELTRAFGTIRTVWRPDVVHLNVFRTAHLVEACGPTPVIVDLDEFRSEYYEQLAAHGPNLAYRMLGRIEAPRMRAREDELVRRGVTLVVSAPPEPGRERPHTHVVRSPCDFAAPHRRPPVRPTVLFVGRLTYEANVSGLRWFVRECWPEICRAVPAARLKIVGSDPPRAVRSLASDDIEIRANVADVEPHYADASVAIVPIFRGTGVQMKLIQSLMAGVPTVTTSAAATRAGVVDGVHVRVADDRRGWVDAVAGLLTGVSPADKLAVAGREWAVAHHAPAAVRAQLNAAYAAVTGGPVVAD